MSNQTRPLKKKKKEEKETETEPEISEPVKKKKKHKGNVITARHPDVKLEFPHIIWTAIMRDESGNIRLVDFVIADQGRIHSISDYDTGEIIIAETLKEVRTNLKNKVWDRNLMYALYKLYS